ncbi:MAG TPA: hypothetical protein VJJ02_05400 [Candidatus Paceibacterota bacterium]
MPILVIVLVMLLLVVAIIAFAIAIQRDSLLWTILALLLASMAYKLVSVPSAQELVQKEMARVEQACFDGEVRACRYLAEVERQNKK